MNEHDSPVNTIDKFMDQSDDFIDMLDAFIQHFVEWFSHDDEELSVLAYQEDTTLGG